VEATTSRTLKADTIPALQRMPRIKAPPNIEVTTNHLGGLVNVPSHPMMPRIKAPPNIEVATNHLGGLVNVPSHPMMPRIKAHPNMEVTTNHLGGIVNVSSQPIFMSPTTINSVSATPAFLVLQLSLILSTLIYQTLHSFHLKTEMKIILDCEEQFLIGLIVFRDLSFCIHLIHIKCIKLVTVDILLYCYTFTIYTYLVVLNTILVCVEISAVRIET